MINFQHVKKASLVKTWSIYRTIQFVSVSLCWRVGTNTHKEMEKWQPKLHRRATVEGASHMFPSKGCCFVLQLQCYNEFYFTTCSLIE